MRAARGFAFFTIARCFTTGMCTAKRYHACVDVSTGAAKDDAVIRCCKCQLRTPCSVVCSRMPSNMWHFVQSHLDW
jgi:hypothetical protein